MHGIIPATAMADEEAAQRLCSTVTYDLDFKDVCVDVKGTTILKKVSGRARQGHMLAIMGPSGSGKSTLLNALFGKYKMASGTIRVGDQPISKQHRRKMAYVLQQDIMFASLTLEETLHFTTMLRLPEKMPKSEKLDKLTEMVDTLELSKCMKTLVGGPTVPGLSGGEKKRANIACELLSNPELLLMDEPTTGLDAFIAFQLMCTLQSYAQDHNKTLVTTIHQPSSKMFYMFDSLLLLCNGQVAYFGPADSMVDHFSRIGYQCDPEYNPADFLMDVLAAGGETEETITRAAHTSLVRNFSGDELHSQGVLSVSPEEHHHQSNTEALPAPDRWVTGFWTQYVNITRRECLLSMRWFLHRSLLLQCVILSLAVSLLYWRRPRRDDHVRDRMGLIVFLLLEAGFNPMYYVFVLYNDVKDVHLHQRSTGMYRVSAYYLSLLSSHLPLGVILPLARVFVSYWATGLAASAANFFSFMAVILVHISALQAMGLLVGIVFNHMKHGLLFLICVGNVGVMMAGFYITNIPVWMAWLQYLAPFSYTFQALCKVEFGIGPPVACAATNATVTPLCLHGNVTELSGADVLQIYGLTAPVWIDLLALAGFTVVFHILAYTALRTIRKPKALN